ncbi:hypothetical protein [Marinobacter shengliensis]|uniref:hypothetical protein n=1 Tax=Marinobacter shengliensis TaxID=1389223 RepID=UPI0035BA661F|tara:strand:- start:1914 stop:2171 length:258 start_codon:yes stop_codon:yes gene_type:complete
MSSDWIETTLSLKKDQTLREVEPEVDESRQIDPSKTSYEMCTENGEVVGFIKTWEESDGYAGYVHFDSAGNVIDWKVMRERRKVS